MRGRSLKYEMDMSTLRQMRLNGMSNKQIAESLDISISTVYKYIGRKAQDQKYAEIQNKPNVVPITDLRPAAAEAGAAEVCKKPAPAAAEAAATVVCEAPAPAGDGRRALRMVGAKYRMQGGFCTYVIDTDNNDIEVNGDILNGLLDRDTLDDLIGELCEIRDMLEKCGGGMNRDAA